MPTIIAAERIRELLLDFFAGVPGAGFLDRARAAGRICLTDHTYSPVSRAEIRRVATENPLPAASPPDELNDCDDFALHIKASLMARRRGGTRPRAPRAPPAVGMVIAERHAVNLFVSAVSGGLRVSLFDAGRPGLPVAATPEDAGELLLEPPVIRWIYL